MSSQRVFDGILVHGASDMKFRYLCFHLNPAYISNTKGLSVLDEGCEDAVASTVPRSNTNTLSFHSVTCRICQSLTRGRYALLLDSKDHP
jgi:hypothetical protein